MTLCRGPPDGCRPRRPLNGRYTAVTRPLRRRGARSSQVKPVRATEASSSHRQKPVQASSSQLKPVQARRSRGSPCSSTKRASEVTLVLRNSSPPLSPPVGQFVMARIAMHRKHGHEVPDEPLIDFHITALAETVAQKFSEASRRHGSSHLRRSDSWRAGSPRMSPAHCAHESALAPLLSHHRPASPPSAGAWVLLVMSAHAAVAS